VAAVDRGATVAVRSILHTTWSVAGAVGVGVDVCPYARLERSAGAWRGRAKRIFSPEEHERFGDRLALPWAAREAVLKALSMPSVLGAPLREMTVSPTDDGAGLVYAPTGEARAALVARGLQVALRTWEHEGAAIVAAVASQHGAPTGTACLRVIPDGGKPSETARRAAEAALRSMADAVEAPRSGPSWEGGGDRPPQWLGQPEALVSVSHDAGQSAALVFTPERASV
jgi:phosphopantetheinyl transferase (holo-ACP synthase)